LKRKKRREKKLTFLTFLRFSDELPSVCLRKLKFLWKGAVSTRTLLSNGRPEILEGKAQHKVRIQANERKIKREKKGTQKITEVF